MWGVYLCHSLVEALCLSIIAFGWLIMNFKFAPLGRLLNVGRLFFEQFLTSGSLTTLESVI